MTTKEQAVQSEENQSVLNKKIQEVLYSTVQGRKEAYEKGTVKAINRANIFELIAKTSNTNAAISGAVGMIPGPWGMAAAVPEIVLIIKNQMRMIYDIGMAQGKSTKDMTPELILGVFVSSTGSAAVGVLSMQGSKILVKRSSLRVIQKVIAILGGRVTQQVAKSAVAKWIPIAGAVAMAAWSKISTKKLGDKALEIFSKEIVYEGEEINKTIELNDNDYKEMVVDESNNEQEDYPREKIKVLINLVKVDGKLDERELEFMSDIITDSILNENEKTQLIQSLSTKEMLDIDFEILKSVPNESIPLMLDLIRLSNIDEELHVTEKMYIKQIGKALDFDKEEINELLVSEN